MGSDAVAEHDGRPPLFGTAGALAASVLAGAVVADTPFGIAVSLVGTACVGLGLLYARQLPVTLGVGVLLFAVLTEGTGSDPLWLVVAAGLASLTWVLASHAVRLGRQIGRGSETARVELVHAVATVTVVGAGGGGGYVVFQSSTGATSLLAVGLFLASVVAVVLALR